MGKTPGVEHGFAVSNNTASSVFIESVETAYTSNGRRQEAANEHLKKKGGGNGAKFLEDEPKPFCT